MQKIGLNKVERWFLSYCLFALSFFLHTHPVVPQLETELLLSVPEALSVLFSIFSLCVQVGGRVTLGPICLPCTHARLLLWQHVARGPQIILLPLLACGHRTSLHNHVNHQSPPPKAVQIHLMWLLLR